MFVFANGLKTEEKDKIAWSELVNAEALREEIQVKYTVSDTVIVGNKNGVNEFYFERDEVSVPECARLMLNETIGLTAQMIASCEPISGGVKYVEVSSNGSDDTSLEFFVKFENNGEEVGIAASCLVCFNDEDHYANKFMEWVKGLGNVGVVTFYPNTQRLYPFDKKIKGENSLIGVKIHNEEWDDIDSSIGNASVDSEVGICILMD